ncbi:DUF1203 domain-containing protein [Amylibacter sp. SFDW26]|uniref:DUF1203 domain-containing protein n=1 Tax=Amylibacter sp. SFDW26 TaxID=2652722 RepID=UPI0012624CFF|nr:DUF1203 domain-containing protein [Amylibacter sp. SFDW26]KAB7615310.1 DUF1203 domain-containing protein [Amylibacter sp. SFDW26]
MPFQIHALDQTQFEHYFSMSEQELTNANAVLETVTESPGYPCRVSLADAKVGETILLVNYSHLPEASPYQASHAIYVRKDIPSVKLEPDTIPDVISSRLISIRAFDNNHMMQRADVVDGKILKGQLEEILAEGTISYIHLHNAKQGCFAAKVTRAA